MAGTTVRMRIVVMNVQAAEELAETIELLEDVREDLPWKSELDTCLNNLVRAKSSLVMIPDEDPSPSNVESDEFFLDDLD